MTFLKQISLLALAACLGLGLVGCQPSDPDAPNVATVASIAVTPNPVNLEVGGVRALTVTGTLTDASTFIVTFGSTFKSSAPDIAEVDAATGYVTARAPGNATITATHTDSGKIGTAEVTVNAGAGGAAPTDKPTTVIPAGSTVIYSDAAAAAGFNPYPDWGQATQFSEVTIDGNKSLKYTNLNYQGIEFTAVDVSSKSKIHFDFWSPDLPSVMVSIISAGKENAVTQMLTMGSWNSVDIDLSNYIADKTAIIQIKFDVQPGSGTLYVDNIYFGTASGGGATAPTDAPTTVIPAGSITIYSDATAAAGFNPYPNWGQTTQFSEATIAGNKSLKYTSLNYQGIEFTAVDVSAKSKIHFDFWSPDLTSVKVSIISPGPVENAYTQVLTTGSWNSVDIDLSSYIADKTAIFQIKLEATTPGTLYVDNIYFGDAAGGGGSGSCGTTDPTCAPTTVIPAGSATIYSDTVAAAGFNPYPNWGQTTQFSEATIDGNKSLKYTNLNYQGIEFTALDVSSKGKIHFDFWSPDLTSVKVSIISAGKENPVTQSLVLGSWNSVDIDLSSYIADKTAIFQIKFDVQPGSGTLYVDNIYFGDTN